MTDPLIDETEDWRWLEEQALSEQAPVPSPGPAWPVTDEDKT